MSLYMDLSEFLTNPIRTGIQRISGEICRYLPANAVVPIRIAGGRYVALPKELIGVIGRYFKDAGDDEITEIRRMGAPDRGSPVEPAATDTVLVPEVFDNAQRLAYFRTRSEADLKQFRFIVYDLLPMTHPEFFVAEGTVPIYAYYQLLRRASHCGFISKYTRDMYYTRLKRTSPNGGVVLPLGCDALGARPEHPDQDRPLHFSVLGTIEPRKNHRLILDAFEPLLEQVPGLSLSFIGRMGWVDPAFAQRLEALAARPDSGFRFFSAPDDDAIRRHIRHSRATIYVSAAEGYGLPPVESLWVGTPVIASTSVPSLERLGSSGIHYVEPLNVVNLRRAVLAFVDNHYANQKVEEACRMNLPTWYSFTTEVLDWCSQ